MESVFISYKFRESDRQVAANVKRLVQSHLLTPQDGEDLGGEQLWAEVGKRIQSADALVALFLLPHDPTEHTWIRTEYDHACDKQRPVIAVVQDGFNWADPRNKEYVKYDPNLPLATFLKLSATLGGWRRDAGRDVQVWLLPQQIAQFVAQSGYSCRYRLRQKSKAITDWTAVEPGKEPGGIGFRVWGIREDMSIEIEVKDGTRALYLSAADPHSVPAQLEKLAPEPSE